MKPSARKCQKPAHVCGLPGEETHELAHLLAHAAGAAAQIVLEELADEALQHQDLPDGWVGGEGTQQRDAVACDGRGAAVTLGGRGVAAAQHGERPVLAGREGGLVGTRAGARGACGRLPLL